MHGHEREQYGDLTLHGLSNANKAHLRARPREAEGQTKAKRPPAPRHPGLPDRPGPNHAPKGGRLTDRSPPHTPPRGLTAAGAQARPRGGARPKARHGEERTEPPPPRAN